MKKQLLLTRMLLLVALLVGSVSVWATDYVPVTSTSQLVAGKNYIIVGRYKTNKMDSPTWHSLGDWASDIYGSTSITVSGDINGSNSIEDVTVTDLKESHIITLGGSTGSWTLYDNSDSKYLSYSGSSNKIFQSTTAATDNQKWTISLASTGAVTITNKAVSGRSIYANLSSSRFACYTGAQSGSTTWLFVEDSSGPSISASSPVEIECDATSGEFSYTLNNSVDGGELSATDNVDWISDVVVNTGTNKVTFNTTANSNPTPREGTITMTYKKGDETLATKEVTISQAESVVLLNYTKATQVVPGRHYIITSGIDGSINAMGADRGNNHGSVGLTASENKTSFYSNEGVCELIIGGDMETGYYTLYDVGVEKYISAASSGSNNMKYVTTLDGDAKWTIDIDGTGKAVIQSQGDYSRNTIRHNSGNNPPLFSCYASDKQSDIYLFERDGDTSIQNADVSIAANKEWITYCCPFALDFSEDIEGLEGAYTISSHTSGATTLTATKMNGMVKAGTGLLLHAANVDADNAQAIAIKMAGTGVEQSGNMLKGVIVDTEITPTEGIYTNLGLKNGSFVPYSAAGTIAAKKAYLQIPTDDMPKTVDAKLTIIFDNEHSDETTAIAGVEVKKGAGVVYNLAGQRVTNPTKGLYIINGKKVIIK